ncbi:ABC transporter permease [Candidatus Omnitrophota bacterium]
MKTLLQNKLTLTGTIIVGLFLIIGLLAPIISPHDPAKVNITDALLAPSADHLFGTDYLGRDVLSRMIYGSRISLSIGFVAVGFSVFIGIIIGSIAGYYGGKMDTILMRFVDMMLCFPSFFLILAVIAVLEPNIMNIMIVIGLTSWMGVARLIRAEILSLKEREFILAARALGASDFRIILFHLIPNGIAPVLVSAVLGIAAAVLVESSLSFLGLGVQPPTPSWGNILMEGKSSLGVCWWLMLYPGLAILITVLGYNLLGEGLREHFSSHK